MKWLLEATTDTLTTCSITFTHTLSCFQTLKENRALSAQLLEKTLCANTAQVRHKVNKGCGSHVGRQVKMKLVTQGYKVMGNEHAVVVKQSYTHNI